MEGLSDGVVVSAGFQAGGKAYSQIIFFEDKRALDEFESGTFEFTAGASAVAITAAAGASVGTSGASAGCVLCPVWTQDHDQASARRACRSR